MTETTSPPRWLLTLQVVVRWLSALSFIVAGIGHFTHHDLFLLLMPTYLPWHSELVWISGVFEIMGGVGLLVPRTRRVAAWGLLLLLVAVLPANVHMAMNQVELPIDGLPQSELGRWLRLPYQAIIALQVWFAGLWRTTPGA